jgi:hypothetical protein
MRKHGAPTAGAFGFTFSESTGFTSSVHHDYVNNSHQTVYLCGKGFMPDVPNPLQQQGMKLSKKTALIGGGELASVVIAVVITLLVQRSGSGAGPLSALSRQGQPVIDSSGTPVTLLSTGITATMPAAPAPGRPRTAASGRCTARRSSTARLASSSPSGKLNSRSRARRRA